MYRADLAHFFSVRNCPEKVSSKKKKKLGRTKFAGSTGYKYSNKMYELNNILILFGGEFYGSYA